MMKSENEKKTLVLKGITKRFPGVIANDNINLDFREGEVHAILGENGAGKTTLMNILYGLIQPDEGEIYFKGKKVVLKSPHDAIKLGIGMVHQHFMLVPTLEVWENVILGLKTKTFLDKEKIRKKILEISKEYNLKIDPDAKIWQLSTGEKQRVEIIKMLYRGARVLILDEPTSMLTPQEVKELFVIVKRMAKKGLAVIPFITHKLEEVIQISDVVTVLRKGKVIGTVRTKDTNKGELAEMMVGRKVLFKVPRYRSKKDRIVLEVKNVSALSDKGIQILKNVSFSLRAGEILGIAGVAGNGQRELSEVITGLRKPIAGNVIILGEDVTGRDPKEIIEIGVGFIPEDRKKTGLVLELSVAENLVLRNHFQYPFSKKPKFGFGKVLDYNEIIKFSEKLISDFQIITPSTTAPAGYLSGGNLQKVILARELSFNPKVLIACNPTAGLDVGATEFIRMKIMEQKRKGTGILLISEDLNEVLSLSDRIAVIFEGKIMGTVSPKTKIEKIGQLMAGVKLSKVE